MPLVAQCWLGFLLGVGGIVWAAAAPQPQMQVQTRDGDLYIDASIAGPYTAAEAWELLTDFDRVDEYVPHMDSSRVVARTDSSVWVRQVFTSRFILPWTFRFTLEFVDRGQGRLYFRQLEGNLRSFEGTWLVQTVPEGVRIAYRARAGHGLRLPDFMLRYIARRQIKRLMPAQLQELARRRGGG